MSDTDQSKVVQGESVLHLADVPKFVTFKDHLEWTMDNFHKLGFRYGTTFNAQKTHIQRSNSYYVHDHSFMSMCGERFSPATNSANSEEGLCAICKREIAIWSNHRLNWDNYPDRSRFGRPDIAIQIKESDGFQKLSDMQNQADDALIKFKEVDLNNRIDVLEWFKYFLEAYDFKGVHVDVRHVYIALIDHGYEPNANCDDDFNKDDPANVADWVIGQALHGLSSGAAPQIIQKFADDAILALR